MNSPTTWYIVKQSDGSCTITVEAPDQELPETKIWGPFDSPEAAIARRVGLIRAGKCRPVQPSPPSD